MLAPVDNNNYYAAIKLCNMKTSYSHRMLGYIIIALNVLQQVQYTAYGQGN